MLIAQIRNEAFSEIGQIIERDAELLTEKWLEYLQETDESLTASHRQEMKDSLPEFIASAGKNLASNNQLATDAYLRLAAQHGKQRWDVGWNLRDVIEDYQLLRIVVIQHLADELPFVLQPREVVAIGVAIDDGILEAVCAFVAFAVGEAA